MFFPDPKLTSIIHRVCLNLAVWLSRAGHQDKLGVAETKLLHTLHWMLLEAPQDCNSERFGGTDRGSSWGGSSSAFIHQVENQGSPGQPCQSSSHDEEENNRRKIFQNSMATVELFVFLFAPLVHRIKVSRKLVLAWQGIEVRCRWASNYIFIFNRPCPHMILWQAEIRRAVFLH